MFRCNVPVKFGKARVYLYRHMDDTCRMRRRDRRSLQVGERRRPYNVVRTTSARRFAPRFALRYDPPPTKRNARFTN